MPTIRERVARALFRPEVNAIQGQLDVLSEFVARRPYLVSSGDLSELDSRSVDYMVRHLNDIRLGGGGEGGEPDESSRLASVAQCRHLYYYDPITHRIISLWTDYGFGTNLEITCRDEQAQEVWAEYWTAKRNMRVLGPKRRHVHSNRMLSDGEFYWLHFVDERTGLVTTRVMLTDQVTRIVTPNGDSSLPLYYERHWIPPGQRSLETWWYQDADATAEDLQEIDVPAGVRLASAQQPGTDVYAAQIAWPSLSMRGWPLMTSGADWAQGYKNFMEDRAAVTAAAAMFYRKIKVKGGSRMVDAVAAKLRSSLAISGVYNETNPPPTAGSDWITNQAVDTEESPMHTGAGDADKDGASMLAMAGIAAGIFLNYLGRGESFRLATATSLEEPIRRQFTRYRAFWASVWRDMANFTLDMQTKYKDIEWDEEQRDIDVSTDSLVETDLTGYSDSLEKLLAAGLIDKETGSRLALQALNVPDIDEILLRMADAETQDQEATEREQQMRGLLEDLFREAWNNAPSEEARLAAEVGLETLADMGRNNE